MKGKATSNHTDAELVRLLERYRLRALKRQQLAVSRQPAFAEATRGAFRTLEDIETAFKNAAALDGVTWPAIWPVLGTEYGFVDSTGRVRPWALRYRLAARRGYVRGRRSFLVEERLRTLWEDQVHGTGGRAITVGAVKERSASADDGRATFRSSHRRLARAVGTRVDKPKKAGIRRAR
jgi:hypothetical protein